MELMCGSGSAELLRVQRLIDSLALLTTDPPRDFLEAAAIYRSSRSIGRPVRKITDCLIAAVALRHDAELWHKDADYEAIAAAVPLRAVDLRG